MSLGPWVHLIEELQLFDQEPVESLVLSRSKVAIRPHPPCPRMAPSRVPGQSRGGEMPERGARTLVESALCGRPIFYRSIQPGPDGACQLFSGPLRGLCRRPPSLVPLWLLTPA